MSFEIINLSIENNNVKVDKIIKEVEETGAYEEKIRDGCNVEIIKVIKENNGYEINYIDFDSIEDEILYPEACHDLCVSALLNGEQECKECEKEFETKIKEIKNKPKQILDLKNVKITVNYTVYEEKCYVNVVHYHYYEAGLVVYKTNDIEIVRNILENITEISNDIRIITDELKDKYTDLYRFFDTIILHYKVLRKYNRGIPHLKYIKKSVIDKFKLAKEFMNYVKKVDKKLYKEILTRW